MIPTTTPPGADSQSDELLPCPFCGGTDIAQKHGDPVALRWQYIQCHGCGASSIQSAHMYRAIAAWNRRAASAPVQGEPDTDELHFNAQRLRNVAVLVGLESAVPQDDATLDGARGAILGQIAAKLRADTPLQVSGGTDERRKHDIANRLAMWLSASLDDHARSDEYSKHIRAWLDHDNNASIATPAAPVAAPDEQKRPDLAKLRRYACFEKEDGIYESQWGSYVLFADVEALLAPLSPDQPTGEK